jgi:hypothetical protein
LKLLFLDMDGVMNSSQSCSYFWRTKHGRKCFMPGFNDVCPIAGNNLNHLLEQVPDLRIVISSAWRCFWPLSDWNKMADVCPEIVNRVIGMTPEIRDAQRGDEIEKYLYDNGHGDTPFVVIDDNDDMDKVRSQFVLIDGAVGLTWNDLQKIAMKLGVKVEL